MNPPLYYQNRNEIEKIDIFRDAKKNYRLETECYTVLRLQGKLFHSPFICYACFRLQHKYQRADRSGNNWTPLLNERQPMRCRFISCQENIIWKYIKTCDFFLFPMHWITKTSSTKRCTKLKDKIICFNSCWHRRGHPCRKSQFVDSLPNRI